MLWPNPLKKLRFVRVGKNENKNCFQIFFSTGSIALSLFSLIKISNESEIKFIFYLLFRWWFLPYIMWKSSSFFFVQSREWGTWQKSEREKTCCLLLLSEILFVSWCQTIFIYSQHTLYYSAKIVQTLNLLLLQIGIQDNKEWRKGDLEWLKSCCMQRDEPRSRFAAILKFVFLNFKQQRAFKI